MVLEDVKDHGSDRCFAMAAPDHDPFFILCLLVQVFGIGVYPQSMLPEVSITKTNSIAWRGRSESSRGGTRVSAKIAENRVIVSLFMSGIAE